MFVTVESEDKVLAMAKLADERRARGQFSMNSGVTPCIITTTTPRRSRSIERSQGKIGKTIGKTIGKLFSQLLQTEEKEKITKSGNFF